MLDTACREIKLIKLQHVAVDQAWNTKNTAFLEAIRDLLFGKDT